MCPVFPFIQDASLRRSPVLTHFPFSREERGPCSPVWVTLHSAAKMFSGHSPNSVYFAIFLQRAVTKIWIKCTAWRLVFVTQIGSLLYPIEVNNVQANPPLFRLWFSSICCLCRDGWLGLWSSQVVVGFRISKRTTTLETIEGQG